ncbi:MAG: preprotein translocase subunit SecE [Bacteroidetes bacterium]|nr:preprotein translocase subunit SecE [candidate division KSB1 bacterium]MCH8903601.1 preprotein translocase subunit SecE [Bacteroidota bacterium]
MFKKIASFIQEVRTEMTRVSWPSREELRSSTKVIMVVSFAFIVFTFIIDNILKYLFDLFYGF